jgi:hypothetical protein
LKNYNRFLRSLCFPPLKANEQVKPDPDHSQYIAGKMEGVDGIAYKKGKVDPFLPQDIW